MLTVLVWLGRASAVVGCALAAVLCGATVMLLAAAVTTEPALFVGLGLLAALGTWLAAHRLLLRRSPALRPRAVTATGAVVVVAVLGSVLIPLGDRVVPPELPPGSGTWQVPDGGSLAYGVVRAPDDTPDATPVVVVHGGPGVPDTAGLLRTFGPLAVAGHDVWAYDQRGTGRSSRLADPSGYTTTLGVADLEAVRERIGTERVIVVGHSYGAYLAAAYIAEHPDRVERAVFLSPGGLGDRGLGGNPQARLTPEERMRVYRLLVAPRALLTYALVQVDPAAAHALAGDREVDARQDRVYAATLPGLHCPGRTGPELHGMGFYAAAVPQSARRSPEPDVAAHLGLSDVPALVVKGQCDYLDWESATEYLRAFADSHLLYLPGAGHDVHVDEPSRVRDAVGDFMAGRPVRGVLDDPMTEPADYQP